MDKIPMTAEGYAALEKELKHCQQVERPRIIQQITDARTHGDLSENAEYHAAKESQSHNEGRIAELEDKLARAEVIDVSKLSGDTITFGATVTLVDEDTEKKQVWQLVGEPEADAKKGKISITSPLARALIGKGKGTSVEVMTPSGAKAYEIKKVEWRPTKVTSTRVLALLNGTIDMTDSFLPVDQVERIDKAPNAHVAKNVTMRLLVIRMNNTKPPFDNINARKCFAHAFNYTGFIEEIVKGNALRNPAPLPNNIWGYPKDVAGYDFDLAKAKEYFQKAVAEGAPMRRPIELHVQQALEQTIQAGQLFQSDLATVGINLKLVNDTFANLTSAAAKPETTPDMWIHWVSTYYVDPDNWIGQMYDSRYHGTWKASCWYTNPAVDELLRKARFIVEQEDRAPLYEQAARLVVADSPDIWIYNMIELCGIANRVQGFRHCPVGSGGEVRWMHLAA